MYVYWRFCQPYMELQMDILSILKTFGIEANNEDINAIIELREIEDEHLPVLQETAADLQAQLDLVQADIAKATGQIASYKARIGTLKASTTPVKCAQDSGLSRIKSSTAIVDVARLCTGL